MAASRLETAASVAPKLEDRPDRAQTRRDCRPAARKNPWPWVWPWIVDGLTAVDPRHKRWAGSSEHCSRVCQTVHNSVDGCFRAALQSQESRVKGWHSPLFVHALASQANDLRSLHLQKHSLKGSSSAGQHDSCQSSFTLRYATPRLIWNGPMSKDQDSTSCTVGVLFCIGALA